KSGAGRRGDGVAFRPRRERERRNYAVERALRDGLNERKLRDCERRRDPGLLLPDQPIPRAQYRAIGQPIHEPEARPEIEFVQFSRGLRESVLPQILELLRLQLDDRSLLLGLRRWGVQRVVECGVDDQARSYFEIVLREEFEDAGARVDEVLLQVNR